MLDSAASNPEPARPVAQPVAAAQTALGPVLIGTSFRHWIAAAPLIISGLLLYGWRAGGCIILVLVATTIGVLSWRRIGLRGGILRLPTALWMATLLALMLPAHLLSGPLPFEFVLDPTRWAIPLAAGLLLAITLWALGGGSTPRLHPVLIVYLLLAMLFGQLLVPHQVLQFKRMGWGDIADIHLPSLYTPGNEPWYDLPRIPGHDAFYLEPAAERLSAFTNGRQTPDRAWLSLEGLLRDHMPPLEDLIVGGHPGPLGISSAMAVIVGGLLLVYLRLAGLRLPILILAVAFAAFLILPVPVVITENGPQWHLLAFSHSSVDWATAITFANYELLAGPLPFMAFFLATSSPICPLSRAGRTFYAIAAGILAAAGQLYLSVSYGPYLALLLASLLTPTLDKWLARRQRRLAAGGRTQPC